MAAYLRAVFLLRQGNDAVPTQRIAHELGVSGPSVTNMVKRLHALGLLRHERYHGVELTEAGERVALRATRLHRLLELYLVEALGFRWDEVHDEADRLMPHVSEKLETRLEAVLGHPGRDPHGDPIPTRDGVVAPVSHRRLLDLGPGAAATVARVAGQDPERLRYLAGLGIRPGVTVAVLEVLPFDGPLRVGVGVGGDECMVGRPLAAAVYVAGSEPEPAPGV
ncbi:MAG: metal-dependent transcriptional regulator [Chloroflexia bacterium]|nr:metal-dependent transcriptional regulator [Chloroflexia bacterium]